MTIGSAAGDGPSVAPVPSLHDGGGSVSIADASILFLGDYSRQGHDLLIEHDGTTLVVQDYFVGDGANLVGPTGAFLTASVVEALAGPAAPGQYAQAGTAPSGAALVEIGKVVSVEGTATATHADGVTVDLANGDPVYQGDVVRTGAASKLGISFIDDSVFSLSADARMVLDELVFDPAKAADSSMVVNLVQGSFVFVTGQVAPTGNMKVETPVATMGIRGTTPKVLINTDLGVTEFTILPDPGSGKIGSYLLLDKTSGEILGTVESVGDKWVITSLSGEAVKIAKSGLDLLEDERALADIRDAVSNALGKRTEYDGSSSFHQVAFDSSASADGQGDGQGDNGNGGGPGGGNGGPVDPTPDMDDPPTAGDDSFATNEDLILVGGNVINGSGGGADADPEGFALTVTQVNGANLSFAGGTASVVLPANADFQTVGAILLIGQNGGVTYDPTSAFNYLAVGESAIETFTYTISDKFGFTDTATVNITVQGRNDAPVITAGPVLAEIAESSEGGGSGGGFTGDARTGTLTFTDVDISDTGHEYAVIGVLEQPSGGALPNPLGGEALLAMLNTLGSTDSGATGTDGTIVWTFTGTEDQFDYLAAGESVTLVYTVQVTDPHGATDTQTVTIKITGATDDGGTNDAPVISVEAGDSETAGRDETNAELTATGTLTVTEIDRTDEVDLSVVSVAATGTTTGLGLSNATLKAMLSLSPETVLTDTVLTSQKFTWTFDSDGQAFDYLAEGEQLVLTYTVRADDDIDTGDRTVTITITGTNDAPVVTSAEGGADLDEAAGQTGEDAPALEANGSIAFTDVDVSENAHEVSVAVEASGITTGLALDNDDLEALFGATVNQTGATGINGSVDWTFDATDQAFDYLADGEVLTLTYAVTITDAEGATATQNVTITVTGTNDQPAIEASSVLADTITEQAGVTGSPAAQTADGTIVFSDVDVTDQHSVPTPTLVSAIWSNGNQSMPDPGALVIDAVNQAANSAGWTYSVTGSALDYLADGETLTITYDVAVKDDSGAGANDTSAVQQIVITVTGTNDQPVLTVDTTGGVTEDAATPVLADTGTLSFADVDATDVVSPGATLLSGPTWSGGDLSTVLTPSEITTLTEGFTVDNDSWDYSVANSLVQFLGEGETITFSYTVTATDDSGKANDSDSETVTITITGDNDTPVVTAAAGEAEGNVAEDGVMVAGGTIGFTDVDLTDRPDVAVTAASFEAFAADGVTPFDLTPAQKQAFEDAFSIALNGASTNNGTADWSIDLDGMDLSFLGQDETVTAVFTVTVDDENGGTDTQDITVTINGAGSGDRDDTLYGTPAADMLSGGLGNDTLYGLEANDQLVGDAGNDTLYGGEGDDWLVGGEGTDTYFGGGTGPDQFDAISFRDETGAAGVYANLTTGVVTDTYGNAESATGIEEVDGSANDDTLIGNEADNYFQGHDGSDSYDGAGSGFDQVSFADEAGGTGAVVDLALNSGTDTYGNTESFTDIEVLRGSQWNDQFTGDANDNTFRGLAGDDEIDGGDGRDTVRYDRDANYGGASGVTVSLLAGTATDGFGDTDTLFNIERVIGTNTVDWLIGDNSDNELIGLDGADNLEGFSGNDYLGGGAGNDTLDGGQGDDWLVGGEGTDTYIGGGSGPDQFDAISFRDETGILGVYANLSTGEVTDTYGNTESATGIEEIDGSANDDVLVGNELDNFFRGGDGADSFDGGDGTFDQVSFDDETGGDGVAVNLALGTGTDTWGNVDTFTSIEVLRGSQWDDELIGDSNDNTFRGMAGADEIDGGDGWDQVRYDRDVNKGGTSGVTVDLADGSANGTAIDGFGDEDILINVEHVRGTEFSDEITGNDVYNRLEGLEGDDTLLGDAGDDQLFGGDGSDELTGGEGFDEFILYAGESGADDILDFEIGSDSISLYGYDETTTVISLADDGAGGSNLIVNGQAVASLADVSFETDLVIDYTDHHVITMMTTA